MLISEFNFAHFLQNYLSDLFKILRCDRIIYFRTFFYSSNFEQKIVSRIFKKVSIRVYLFIKEELRGHKVVPVMLHKFDLLLLFSLQWCWRKILLSWSSMVLDLLWAVLTGVHELYSRAYTGGYSALYYLEIKLIWYQFCPFIYSFSTIFLLEIYLSVYYPFSFFLYIQIDIYLLFYLFLYPSI